MSEARSGEEQRRRTMLCWLPLASGAVVLLLCWLALELALSATGAACLGGFGLETVGDSLARDIPVGPVLALLVYVGVSLAPFLLLSGCTRLAARSRTTRFLAVQAVTGTTLVSLYDVLGYVAAYSDLHDGGFLCDLAFELVPIGGLVAGACAIVVGSLAAIVVEWRRRAPS